jgi:hypothetical protein
MSLNLALNYFPQQLNKEALNKEEFNKEAYLDLSKPYQQTLMRFFVSLNTLNK